jgi:tetratricopeptide (TPR) repeat protein
LLYARYVRNERPDVTIYDRSGNVFGDTYQIEGAQHLTVETVNKLKFDKDLEILSQAPGEVYLGDTRNKALSYTTKGVLFLAQKEGQEKQYLTDQVFGLYQLPDINKINPLFKNREEWSRYRLMKARGYLNEQKIDQALVEIDQAKEIAPDAWYTMEYTTYLYLAINDQEKALATLKQATKSVPHLAAPSYRLGLLLTNQGDIPAAKSAYEHALTVEPGNIEVKQALEGLAFYQPDSQLSQSIKDLEKRLEAEPDNPTLYQLLGTAYGQRGETNKAIENFQKALTLDDTIVEAHLNLGNAFMNMVPPQPTSARVEFEKVIELDPSQILAYLNLGSLCAYELVDYECALANWQEYINQLPNAPEKADIELEINRIKSVLNQIQPP